MGSRLKLLNWKNNNLCLKVKDVPIRYSEDVGWFPPFRVTNLTFDNFD